MKKNLTTSVLTIILSLCFVYSYAQESSSFGAFMATPVGKFKSTDLDGGGFAKAGWGIVFDSKNNFNFLPEPWSVYFHSTYQWNEMDSEAVSARFTEALGHKAIVSDSKYSPFLTTIGPAYDIDLGDRFQIALNGSVGIAFTSTKAFTVKVYDESDVMIINELVNFDNKVAFAYTAGAELKYELVKDLFSVALYFDYTGSNQSTDISFKTADPTESFQKLQYVNTGIKLVLNKKRQ